MAITPRVRHSSLCGASHKVSLAPCSLQHPEKSQHSKPCAAGGRDRDRLNQEATGFRVRDLGSDSWGRAPCPAGLEGLPAAAVGIAANNSGQGGVWSEGKSWAARQQRCHWPGWQLISRWQHVRVPGWGCVVGCKRVKLEGGGGGHHSSHNGRKKMNKVGKNDGKLFFCSVHAHAVLWKILATVHYCQISITYRQTWF